MSSDSAAVSLHPLVLVNVSDHLTRHEHAGNRGKVVGILFGTQNGQSVDVLDSAEIEYKTNGAGEFEMDRDFITSKVNLTTEVFPQYELIGWYCVGNQVEGEHMLIHKNITEFNETPLFLLMGSNITSDSQDLPINLFESVMQVVKDVPAMTFVDREFKIEATEPERITVDNIVKGGGGNSSGSTLVLHMKDLHNSVQKLTQRMRLLEQYLVMTQNGEIPPHSETLQEISAVCNSLPVADSLHFQNDFQSEYDDAKLIAFLASITKGTATLGEVQGKVKNYIAGAKKGSNSSEQQLSAMLLE